ncbi:MAG: hypothetical protein ACI87W_000315 [Halieaceae bacterium]|jgi:hypothetical protein
MRSPLNFMFSALLLWAATAPLVQPASAHLMVAQHGTLNMVDDGVFMVLSLPVSAFAGVDDDKDGQVSMLEFNNHRADIMASVREKVTLMDRQGAAALHGLMLSPVAPHDGTSGYLSQVTVLGRFALNDSAGALHFYVGLYGRESGERSLEITATRASDKQQRIFQLTPEAAAQVIFPGKA